MEKKNQINKQLDEDFLLFSKFGMNEEAFDLHDPDSDFNILDNDSISSATATDSFVIENVSGNNEMEPFMLDETAFGKAKMLANEKESNYDDEIEWEDLDCESSETTSLTIGSTECLNYLLENDNKKKKNQTLTPCVLLHLVNGQIKRCSNYNQKSQRPLAQLVGTWEIDGEAFESVKNNDQLYTLGVCGSHFGFDQNDLHDPNLKNSQSIGTSWIYCHRCLFCSKNKHFFSRGTSCIQHATRIIGRDVQVPCIGLKKCPVFVTKHIDITENNQNASNNDLNKYQPRYICTQCFELHGGHLFQRPGSGKQPPSCNDKHKDDTTQALELLGRWILNIATSNNPEQKKQLLTYLSSVLSFFDKSKSQIQNPPSLLYIKIALRLGQINLTKVSESDNEITPEISKKNGEILGISMWRSRHEVRQNKEILENPSTLAEYRSAFPKCLLEFFNGLITVLQKKKGDIVNKKRKQRGLEAKPFDQVRVEKIIVFFVSVILTIAFPSTDIWLTHVMSSLARKSKLLTSLYSILCTASVVSHTQRYERRLERNRMVKANPNKRLIKGDNVWNVAVVDNIDFKESTFKFGNIYDDTRSTSHATLRLVFQFTLPMPINSLIVTDLQTNNSSNLFGESDFIKTQNYKHDIIFSKLNELDSWDLDSVYHELTKDVPLGCQIPPPNLVILTPGEQPNCDLNVHNSCEMYFNDFELSESEYLDIASDEAIYRRLISYRDSKKNKLVRLLLGQWHTSKAMCTTLITIFSGYGIFALAADLGVRYLDKLEKVVDYDATFHVLELIWMAVGIALTKYLKNKNQNETINDIEKENNIVKVWFLYFRWMGYIINHKIGIRRANYDLQFYSLKAFSPLFLVAGKSNYARSTTHYLAQVSEDPILQQLLRHVCSVNLTRPGHYFAFDEALEVFGVKFVKQNIKSNIIDNEQLKLQISSVQSERDRVQILLSEYVGDIVTVNKDRNVQSRKEAIWKLAENLTAVFQLPNPTTHELFLNAKEINETGFSRISTCYAQGISRLHSIYRQEILKTEERSVKGRRGHNVNTYKLSSLLTSNDKKRKNIIISKPVKNDESKNIPPPKRMRRSTSDNAKEILSQLLTCTSFSDDQLLYNVLHELQDIESGWTKERVIAYWRNHKK